MFMGIFTCVLGVLGMFMAFYAIGSTGLFSRGKGPYGVISKPGRVIIFLIGMAVFVNGLEELMSRSGLLDKGWRVAVSLLAVLLLGLLLNSQPVRTYMGRGKEDHRMVGIDFPKGLPWAMVGVRIVFFVIVAAMVTFGVLPMADSTAEKGIIACVLVLFAVAVLYQVLESHYVKAGRAIEQSSGQNEEE